jgi:hypothetical protein
VAVVALHYLGHGDMTTMKDKVTSMKEEKLASVSFIKPLLVSYETVVVIEYEELISDFSSHSENVLVILSLRAAVGAESHIPEGIDVERVEDILLDNETDNAL